jgi:hypothetical protein
MKTWRQFLLFVLLCGTLTCNAQQEWQQKVNEELPLLGHRNWIVVADSAYPLQSSSGIETVETDADQLAVLDYVLKAIDGSRHVRPSVHLDKELQFVPESDAPGVDQYRGEIRKRLEGRSVDSVPHELLIRKLNDTGATFHILILKTRMAIPYSSVFLQLDCRYWGESSEAQLQEIMRKAHD